MLYSCTHMATVGVKELKHLSGGVHWHFCTFKTQYVRVMYKGYAAVRMAR